MKTCIQSLILLCFFLSCPSQQSDIKKKMDVICQWNCSELAVKDPGIDPGTCEYTKLEKHVVNSSVEYDENGCYDIPHPDLIASTQITQVLDTMVLTLGPCGLIGNILAIIVFSRKEMKGCFNQIMIALNVCDSIHIYFAILEAIRSSYSDYYPVVLQQIFPWFHYPLYRISMRATIYLIMGVALERYLAVCRPHHYYQVQNRPNRSILYIVPCILAAIAINCYRFFETEYALIDTCCHCQDSGRILWLTDQLTWSGSPTYFLKASSLRRDSTYTVVTAWMDILFTGIFPFILLIIINSNIYISMKKLQTDLALSLGRKGSSKMVQGTPISSNGSQCKENRSNQIQEQKRKDINLSHILLCTVMAFFICHTTRVLTTIYQAITSGQEEICQMSKKSHMPVPFIYSVFTVRLQMVIYASLNFPINWFVGSAFKETTSRLFSKLKSSETAETAV